MRAFFFFLTAVYGAALLRDADDGPAPAPAPRELKPAETDPAAISPADDLFSRQSGRGQPMCFSTDIFRGFFARSAGRRHNIQDVIDNRGSHHATRYWHFRRRPGVNIEVTIDATEMTDGNRRLRVWWHSHTQREGHIYLTNYEDTQLNTPARFRRTIAYVQGRDNECVQLRRLDGYWYIYVPDST